jgi:3-methyladenine DNA glycosylase/8-oxoguanine DNA glycosylase
VDPGIKRASSAKSGVGFLVGPGKQGGRLGLEEVAEAKGIKSDEGAKSDHFQMKPIVAIPPRTSRKSENTKTESAIVLQLKYLPPFDGETLLSIFRAHQLPELETVAAQQYERVFHLDGRIGYFRVSHDRPEENALTLKVVGAARKSIPVIEQRVRRMFDLDVNPAMIAECMAGQPHLGDLWRRYPGLRVARTWDRFETLITTILGQLVSVSFGRTLIRELMHSGGERVKHPATGQEIHLFPTPVALRTADLSVVRTSEMRRTAIRTIAALAANGGLPLAGQPEPKELRRTLLGLPGVGAWSAEYIAMRAFDDNDAFPATDYGLKQEIKRYPQMNVNQVRPWRAYAAAALWKHFAEKKGIPDESVV